MTSIIKRCLLLVTVLVFVLCGCASEPTAQEVYDDYLCESEESCASAISKYCHYERADCFEMAMESGDHITSYEIVEWKQLSENLWVAQLKHTTYLCEDMVLYARNFVGLINGSYKVMISVEEIPSYLSEGVNLEEYILERTNPSDFSIIYI